MVKQLKLSGTEKGDYAVSSIRETGNGVTIVEYQKTNFTKFGADLSMVGSREDTGWR